MRRLSLCLFGLLLVVACLGVGKAAPAPRPRQAKADGLALDLRRFREETDAKKRVALLRRFGKVRDPRVSLALMEVVLDAAKQDWVLKGDGDGQLLFEASNTLVAHHIPEQYHVPAKNPVVALIWWDENEMGVRRRAGAFPPAPRDRAWREKATAQGILLPRGIVPAPTD